MHLGTSVKFGSKMQGMHRVSKSAIPPLAVTIPDKASTGRQAAMPCEQPTLDMLLGRGDLRSMVPSRPQERLALAGHILPAPLEQLHEGGPGRRVQALQGDKARAL